MDHQDGVDESWQGVQHGDGVADIERLAELLNGVEELEIVPRLIRSIRYMAVQLTPLLQKKLCMLAT